MSLEDDARAFIIPKAPDLARESTVERLVALLRDSRREDRKVQRAIVQRWADGRGVDVRELLFRLRTAELDPR